MESGVTFQETITSWLIVCMFGCAVGRPLAFPIAKDVQNAHPQNNCAEAKEQQHAKQEDKSHKLIFLSLGGDHGSAGSTGQKK
jgi:hypothetical protein